MTESAAATAKQQGFRLGLSLQALQVKKSLPSGLKELEPNWPFMKAQPQQQSKLRLVNNQKALRLGLVLQALPLKKCLLSGYTEQESNWPFMKSAAQLQSNFGL